jgi:hypothetical protein
VAVNHPSLAVAVNPGPLSAAVVNHPPLVAADSLTAFPASAVAVNLMPSELPAVADSLILLKA